MSSADKAAIHAEEGVTFSKANTTYVGVEVHHPDGELMPLKAVALMPDDDIDYSGFEDQHREEYGQKEKIIVKPPAAHLAWYRDCKTMSVVLFLWSVLLVGTVMLLLLVFTRNPWKIFATIVIYLMASILVIYVEVRAVRLR